MRGFGLGCCGRDNSARLRMRDRLMVVGFVSRGRDRLIVVRLIVVLPGKADKVTGSQSADGAEEWL